MKRPRSERAIETAIEKLLDKNGVAHLKDVAFNSKATVKQVSQFLRGKQYELKSSHGCKVICSPKQTLTD